MDFLVLIISTGIILYAGSLFFKRKDVKVKTEIIDNNSDRITEVKKIVESEVIYDSNNEYSTDGLGEWSYASHSANREDHIPVESRPYLYK
ncbi:hypothetical protein GCM10011344_42550 [Dokdonia pacifica]|uniref:Uncharacterized protein n=1 Tax=Dokdonia pacifica TaxID=1627892 RepID=A0A239DMF4_9FLAO|nr:hypothetical protein [Dokdonia pacifica]GGG37226.1 hypothetical protein GCM10011344_42550 [Dokdonia pacifica]SNS33815.1 hypothetical protein SAMN06265376_111105 [Dokdonia pacifica]